MLEGVDMQYEYLASEPDIKHKLSQKERILRFLKRRGKHGAYNHEFANDLHILKYTNRLSELYKDGHDIRKEYKGNGVFKYQLFVEREGRDD